VALDPELDDCVAAELLVEWPWKDRAARSEIAPVRMTAALTIHRLRREISSRPAFRVLTALGGTLTMIGPARKKTLNAT
jgi:hypothetical protein